MPAEMRRAQRGSVVVSLIAIFGIGCGDGIISGELSRPTGTRGAAVVDGCGDGSVAENEQCDDGNRRDNDGCSAMCRNDSKCGDGVVERDEACDDGNTTNGDACPA